MLATQTFGPDDAALPPLVIAHGLFGSGRNWGVVARRLAEGRRVVTVDMRNHGASPWHDAHAYPDLAADLAAVIATLGGEADLLGHSMGGKAAMALALTAPDRLRRLVVADIAPVAYAHSQRPLVEAMRGMDLAGLDGRAAADARLAARVEDRGVRAFLLQSLDLRADPPRWRLNLDALAAQMDRIMGWPEDLGGRFAGPALFIAGGASDYVRPEHRGAVEARFPAARFAAIPGAGHWLHAEKPAEVVAAVDAFLRA